MGKPRRDVYEAFVKRYEDLNRRLGLKQYLVPYLMSSHPGCSLADAVALAEYLRDTGHQPEQVQDFYPTPGTLSTCMYYTGLDPRDMSAVYVPRTAHEKAMQRALMQWRNPANHPLIREALRLSGRDDLIGYGRECLVPPVRQEAARTSRTGAPRSPRAIQAGENAQRGNAPRPQSYAGRKSFVSRNPAQASGTQRGSRSATTPGRRSSAAPKRGR